MKIKNRSEFAKNLITIRKAKGLSQRDLARLTGISGRMIAYYETRSEIPSMEKLEKIAEVLKVSIADLIDKKATDKENLKLNTRTLKKVKILEKLSPENQRKVMDYINALLAQEKQNKQAS